MAQVLALCVFVCLGGDNKPSPDARNFYKVEKWTRDQSLVYYVCEGDLGC